MDDESRSPIPQKLRDLLDEADDLADSAMHLPLSRVAQLIPQIYDVLVEARAIVFARSAMGCLFSPEYLKFTEGNVWRKLLERYSRGE